MPQSTIPPAPATIAVPADVLHAIAAQTLRLYMSILVTLEASTRPPQYDSPVSDGNVIELSAWRQHHGGAA